MAQDIKRYGVTAAIDAGDIEAELDRLWPQLAADPQVLAILKKRNVAPADFKARPRAEVLSVRLSGQGADPATIALVVSAGALLVEVAKDIWEIVIVPKLKQKYGQDSLPPKDSNHDT